MALFAAPSARAQGGRAFELAWQAPPGCPTSAEVERDIARLIGQGAHSRGTVRAFADVTRRNDDWRVQIRIQDGDQVSERSVDGATCRAVTKVASLIIALAIEPNAGATPEAAVPTPRETPEPPPAAPGRAAEPAQKPRRGFVAMGPVAELGILPRPAFGLELGAGIQLATLSVELDAGAFLPQSTDLPSSAAGGRFSLLTAALRACAEVVAGSPAIFACAAGFLDRVHAEGYGVTAPGSATGLLGTAALGPRIDLSLTGALLVRASIDASYTFGEATFQLDNVGTVHRTPHWGGSARLHIAWLF